MNVLSLPLKEPLCSVPPRPEPNHAWLDDLGVAGPTERAICEMLLAGYSETEQFAEALKIKPRTIKNHFAHLFLLFGIRGGIKRVKLAVLLYRAKHHTEVFHEKYNAVPASAHVGRLRPPRQQGERPRV